MDEVFRALADPSRRLLLDRLFERDGQSLGNLQGQLPMTRFGVMKHLRVLEEAGLVTTRRIGRQKLHYLNPVPIRLVHDRWISRYSEPIVAQLSALKARLEEPPMGAAPRHVYEIYIRTTPERLWRAITDPADTRLYYFGTEVQSDWKVGSKLVYLEGGHVTLDCNILEIDPTHKLVHSFTMSYDPEMAAERPSRVTWEIEKLGDACRLTLVHDEFDGETRTYHEVEHGWAHILSSLKTLIETGQPLIVESHAEEAAGKPA
ncbi:MAG TPA: SRPBCC domain-containing protein [Candidatus Limnocylindrales bacterium]